MVHRQPFGSVAGAAVEQFTLSNSHGLEACAISFGGTITSIRTPDRHGQIGDIVLGFNSLEGYVGAHPYFGAIVGRYANRIAGGRFTIDGVDYALATNNGRNHLHGGRKGFNKVMWSADACEWQERRGRCQLHQRRR